MSRRKGQGIKTGPTGWGQRRRGLGISLDDLALESGITKSRVWMIEQGVSPTPEEAIALGQTYQRLERARREAVAVE